MGSKVSSLFALNNKSEVILPNGNMIHQDLMLITTDLDDELHYTLIIL